ncbi:prohibitin family protein [Polyangium jinanense]|uniref:Prohibitin family protein n=1 Tax=Polyangium jinanense TaxID=2829994 RepID=A0A9X3XDQ4_9BACT|nr:prohibitin family protein [Polyangium jinanense]MDC3961000.1 prohibitin family protein [Polyangium jinanense]MDC3987420.1 prohibitin family protein [Polyangium jinanense]
MSKPEANEEMQKGSSSGDAKKPPFREWLAKWLRKARFTLYTTLVILLFVVGFLWPRIFIRVPAGSSAVMYRFFLGGTVRDRIWGEGLNVIPPWDELTVYETRMQQQKLKFDVLSEEGLNLPVEISVRYQPNMEMLGYLHQDIGVDYFERLIRPEVESHVRRTFGSRTAHEIYTSVRDLLQEVGKVSALGRLDENGNARPYVQLYELKLLDIELPEIVQSAIADKYKQEQLMLEYRFRLEKEEKEAERRRTEAAGVRDYNLIATKVSPDILKWRSIEASLELAKSQMELAKSQNTKVVVLGGGPGTQMLMNVDGATAVPPAAAAGEKTTEGKKDQGAGTSAADAASAQASSQQGAQGSGP